MDAPPVRVLLTNDDGVESEGISVLARAAADLGLDVTVAAPSWDASGSSASLATVKEGRRFLVERRSLADIPGPAYAVEAAPAFIVRAGLLGAFGPPPELVLSGINHGLNTGHTVIHSGTVGAALAALAQRVPAVAFSIEDEPGRDYDRSRWDTARVVVERVVPAALDVGAVALNVNIPAVPPERLRGIARAGLAERGTGRTTIAEAGGGYLSMRDEPLGIDPEPGTDLALVRAHVASVTPILAAVEAMSVHFDQFPDVRVGEGTRVSNLQGGNR